MTRPDGPERPDGHGSEPYSSRNLLDRLTPRARLEANYRYVEAREAALLRFLLPITSGSVLSVGAGWHPGRHLFPAGDFRLTAVDPVPERVAHTLGRGTADTGVVGRSGELEFAANSFDVVLYREVLHHVAFQEPLGPCFAEAHRLLRPGGALVIIEPSSWHPVGAALSVANRIHLGTAVHGTPDDVPLSPRRLWAEARHAGLSPRLAAVTFAWRRLPVDLHRRVRTLDRLGTRLPFAWLGHTMMLVASKPPHRAW